MLTPQGFIDWVDGATTVGGENDQGFSEFVLHNEIVQYGDVAHVMSSYAKRYYGQDEILGTGINSIQLVHNSGRWWIAGVAWDEDYAAGPLPEPFSLD